MKITIKADLNGQTVRLDSQFPSDITLKSLKENISGDLQRFFKEVDWHFFNEHPPKKPSTFTPHICHTPNTTAQQGHLTLLFHTSSTSLVGSGQCFFGLQRGNYIGGHAHLPKATY